MKKNYIVPETIELKTLGGKLMKITGEGSLPPMGPSSAARRITVLGSIGGGAGVGSLGSIGHVK